MLISRSGLAVKSGEMPVALENWRSFDSIHARRIIHIYCLIYLQVGSVLWLCDSQSISGPLKSPVNNIFDGLDNVRFEAWYPQVVQFHNRCKEYIWSHVILNMLIVNGFINTSLPDTRGRFINLLVKEYVGEKPFRCAAFFVQVTLCLVDDNEECNGFMFSYKFF